MPKVPQYLTGFGLQQGSTMAGYVLDKIQIEHDEMVRYREYQYPTTLTWRKQDPGANYNQFKQQLTNYLGLMKVIYTSYGNPYDCNFGTLNFTDNGTTVTVVSTGRCTRNFELPKH